MYQSVENKNPLVLGQHVTYASPYICWIPVAIHNYATDVLLWNPDHVPGTSITTISIYK